METKDQDVLKLNFSNSFWAGRHIEEADASSLLRTLIKNGFADVAESGAEIFYSE